MTGGGSRFALGKTSVAALPLLRETRELYSPERCRQDRCPLNFLPNTLPWLSGYTSAIFRLPGQIYIMKCCCENWVNYFCSIRVIFPIYFMRSSCKTPTCCVKNTHKN